MALLTLSALRLPDLNAGLNALAAVLLVSGFLAIRRRNITVHRRCMIAAFVTSMAFLVSYGISKVSGGHTAFRGVGAIKVVYYAILWTHTPLAAAVPVLAGRTLWFGLKNRIDRHKRLARITLPIWLYVSVTGVVIWWMLFTDTFVPAASQ